MDRHTARSWADPDTKRQYQSGRWDLYCVVCGRFCGTVQQADAPDSRACGRCGRTADLAHGLLPHQGAGGGGQGAGKDKTA